VEIPGFDELFFHETVSQGEAGGSGNSSQT
jgi:hypothetical protein